MKAKLSFEENCPNFKQLAKKEQHPQKRVRLIAMGMLKDGNTRVKIAANLGVERRTVGKWFRRYVENGLDGLNNLPRSGRKTKIPRDQEKEFVQKVLDLQSAKTGGRVTGYDLQEMALKEFNADYKNGSIYDVLNRLGLSWITSRSQHPKADPEAQKAFKKTLKVKLSKVCQKALI